MDHYYKDSLRPRRNTPLVNKVCGGLIEGKYYAVLGPMFIGKTSFLRQIEERLNKEPGLRCLFVGLREYSNLPRIEYYRRLYRDIRDAIGIRSKDTSRITTRGILDGILQGVKERLIILFGGMEALNEDISRELILTLRRCYDQRRIDERYNRLGAVVSGSINLLRLSRGRASPYNIAETILLEGLSEREGRIFIKGLKKGVSDEMVASLLSLTNGHPYLIREILQLVEGEDIDKAVDSFIKRGKEDACLEMVIRDLERSEETFKVFRKMREGRPLRFSKTALPTEPEMSGLFKRGRDHTYEVSNEVFERFLNEYFDNQRLGDLYLLHGDWNTAKRFYKGNG
jgi:hypothetical protein